MDTEETREELAAAKRNAKDTVFRDFFGRKENLLDLYRVLHPEDKGVTEEMLSNVTIENVLTDQIYNDLGFQVGDHLMVLVEAQSTWSPNILVRALLYLEESYREYFRKQEVSLYGKKRINLRIPELYVIFTGNRKRKPREMTLSKEFFGGEKKSVEVTVKVLYGEDKTNVIGQNVRFCKVFNEQVSLHGYTIFAVQETIRICKNENVMKKYLDEREKEVISIMMTLFDKKEIQKAFGKEKFEEGRNEGRTEGETRLLTLIDKLYKSGRACDVQRVAADADYRSELYKAFGL